MLFRSNDETIRTGQGEEVPNVGGGGRGGDESDDEQEEEDNDDAYDENEAAEEAGKSGMPPRFKGDERVLVDGFLDRFIRVAGLKQRKRKEMAIFWADVEEAYWKAFTWEQAKVSIGKKAVDWTQSMVVEKTNKVSIHLVASQNAL